jgi:hypothetical protein
MKQMKKEQQNKYYYNRVFSLGSIVLKPGLTWWIDQEPGAGTGPDWKKNRRRKNPVWPDGLTQRPGWPGKTRLQPVDFCFVFFTITMSFWFKIFLTRSKPEIQSLNRIGSKNYAR